MGWLTGWRVDERRLRAIETRQMLIERRITRMEKNMAKDKDALAELDSQLAELAEYVRSDEDSDAAEIAKRTETVRNLLAEVKANPDVPDEEGASREQELAQVEAEAQAQQAE